MKNLLISCALLLGLVACSSDKPKERIVVGATPVPHAQILEIIKSDLNASGFELVIRDFNDYVQPNLATENGDIDANYFQHTPHLDAYNNEKNGHLVSVANIHLEPMGVYSRKYASFEQLAEGASIAVPGDTSNETRALDLLASTGAISLQDKPFKTKLDIIDNPKKLVIKELKAAMLPRALDDTDFAVINSNYAMEAGFNPVTDSLVQESADNNPYVNILVVKQGNEKSPKIQALIKALQSEKVKKFIEDEYKGAVIPAF